MSAQGEARACHALNARLARAAAVVAGLLLATAIETAAEPPLKPHALSCDILNSTPGAPPPPSQAVAVRNPLGRTIPEGTRIEFTVCTVGGCHKVDRNLTFDLGTASYHIWGFKYGPGSGLLSCTAKVMLPPDFKEKARKHEIPKYSRSRPPGPPGPGLLESSPGGSPQGPSGIGTPKPSAPPPYTSR